MKPNELMIGDWVQVPSLIDDVEHYNAWWKVKQLRDCDLDVIGFKELKYNEIASIPITPEILEKNGFSHIMYSEAYYSIMIGDTYVELRKYENMAVWFNWEENNDGVYADYILPMPEFVHELQHALRLCGIEKEIEL